jgi:outer membrane immunogenic protein
MKRILTSAVAIAIVTALAGTAGAADIRRPAPPVKAPAYVPPPFSWTGFYVGANLGYGWSDGSGTMFVTGVGSGPINGSGNGILGGGQIGYNWQTGAFVFGIETDFQGTGGTGSFSGRLAPGAVPVTGTTETPWFGTIRGRLGYAADRWLFYVTGGGAYSHNKASGTIGVVPFSASATGWSWTVGGGVETALANNWSVKGEYLYIATPDNIPLPPATTIAGNTDTHVLRIGLNYRF